MNKHTRNTIKRIEDLMFELNLKRIEVCVDMMQLELELDALREKRVLSAGSSVRHDI